MDGPRKIQMYRQHVTNQEQSHHAARERYVSFVSLLSPPSEWSEWRRYCFRSMCVCVPVRSGPVNQTSFKLLKLYGLQI